MRSFPRRKNDNLFPLDPSAAQLSTHISMLLLLESADPYGQELFGDVAQNFMMGRIWGNGIVCLLALRDVAKRLRQRQTFIDDEARAQRWLYRPYGPAISLLYQRQYGPNSTFRALIVEASRSKYTTRC